MQEPPKRSKPGQAIVYALPLGAEILDVDLAGKRIHCSDGNGVATAQAIGHTTSLLPVEEPEEGL